MQFRGALTENPKDHITNFVELYDTIKRNGATEDAIRLLLFPFSLRDATKIWLTHFLPIRSLLGKSSAKSSPRSSSPWRSKPNCAMRSLLLHNTMVKRFTKRGRDLRSFSDNACNTVYHSGCSCKLST